MKTTRAIALGSALVLVMYLAAFTSFTTHGSFASTIVGDARLELHGGASFGTVDGRGAAPTVFTISLGAGNPDGSILFTRPSGTRLVAGTYRITGHDDESDDVRALVMTGSAERPTGVFRGRSGTLVIRSVSDNVIRGSYRVEATGFLAAEPAAEDKAIRATGGFTAVRN
jgi:hypothetical protein